MQIPVASKIIDQARTLTQRPEDLLRFLKTSKVSKIRSILVYSEIMNVSLDLAKEIVHFSTAWSEQKSADESLQESIIEMIEGKNNMKIMSARK